MSDFTLAHLSDLHLPFEPRLALAQRFSKRQLSAWSWQRRRALHRPEILEALVDDVRLQGADHVAITGDIVNFSLPGEFVQAAHWLAALAPTERVSVVPGNHDALVRVAASDGMARWHAWTRAGDGWPSVLRRGPLTLIGLSTALPTAPLLARGRLGAEQLERLERILAEEGGAGRVRVVLLHHPPIDGAVRWRKALADRARLRDVLRRTGAELVLHGHARDARLDALPGPREPIPCVCVPSSSAVPNPKDQGARWHRLRFVLADGPPRVEIAVRRWSPPAKAFVPHGAYELCLPRPTARVTGQNVRP
jgi:3',5'-cyclic AMP phosphodiesterase CpdA